VGDVVIGFGYGYSPFISVPVGVRVFVGVNVFVGVWVLEGVRVSEWVGVREGVSDSMEVGEEVIGFGYG
jgi:hypothetical protein